MMTPNSRSCHSTCCGEGFTSVKFWLRRGVPDNRRGTTINAATPRLFMRGILSCLCRFARAVGRCIQQAANAFLQHHGALILAAPDRSHGDLLVAMAHRTCNRPRGTGVKFMNAGLRHYAMHIRFRDTAARHNCYPSCSSFVQAFDLGEALLNTLLTARYKQAVHSRGNHRIQRFFEIARHIESAMECHLERLGDADQAARTLDINAA